MLGLLPNRFSRRADIPPLSRQDLQALDRLTRLVETLMAEGMYDIFQETREKLQVALRDKNVTKFIYKVCGVRQGRGTWGRG